MAKQFCWGLFVFNGVELNTNILAQAAQGSVDSVALGRFKRHVDVVLRFSGGMTHLMLG